MVVSATNAWSDDPESVVGSWHLKYTVSILTFYFSFFPARFSQRKPKNDCGNFSNSQKDTLW